MSVIELPIGDPIIKSYQFVAFPVAISSAYDDTEDWFFNNFIQLFCRTDGEFHVNFLACDIYGEMPFLKKYNLSQSYIAAIYNIGLKELFIRNLNAGYYIYSFVDEYYIPNRMNYQKNHYAHDILIYGCCPEGFLTLGYDASRAFAKQVIDFDIINTAAASQSILALQKIDNIYYKSEPNIKERVKKYGRDRIIEMLEDYLYGKNCIDKLFLYHDCYTDSLTDKAKNRYFYFKRVPNVFGIDVYHYLKLYIMNIFSKHELYNDMSVPMNHFAVLWEHKKIMSERILYISKKFDNPSVETLYPCFKKIEEQALIIRNKLFKMQTGQSITKESILSSIQIIDSMCESEKEAIGELIKIMNK